MERWREVIGLKLGGSKKAINGQLRKNHSLWLKMRSKSERCSRVAVFVVTLKKLPTKRARHRFMADFALTDLISISAARPIAPKRRPWEPGLGEVSPAGGS